MKTVWIINTKDNYEDTLSVYSNKEDAMKEFREIVENVKDKYDFEYEDGDCVITWDNNGYFCESIVWEEEVR